ncbi:hypothetical protein diail_1309 [Diaporthe ilicicola]|nr:hypothetical protein diail_1309 [Diaporthe ilicicola]
MPRCTLNLKQREIFDEESVNFRKHKGHKAINIINDTLEVARAVNIYYPADEITGLACEQHRALTSNHQSRRATIIANMNDLVVAIIIGASGYGGFLAIGVVFLIWYNVWNRRKMEREAGEEMLRRLEKTEAQSGMMPPVEMAAVGCSGRG